MPLNINEIPACTILTYDVSRRGGQSYQRANERLIKDEDGEEIREWETIKTTQDKEEFAKASSLQTKIKYALSKLGASSPLGVVVRNERRAEVEAVVADWERQVAEFNSTSVYTKIDIWAMIHPLTGSNAAQLGKIVDQLNDILGDLGNAIDTMDPKTIRETLQRMNGFTEILPETAADLVEGAIKKARKQANDISRTDKRMTKIMTRINEEVNGKDAEEELARRTAELEQARKDGKKILEMKKRTTRLRNLMRDKEETIQRMERIKGEVSRAPVDQARFAVMRRRGSDQDDQSDRSGAVQGAQQGRRFARLSRGKDGLSAAPVNDAA